MLCTPFEPKHYGLRSDRTKTKTTTKALVPLLLALFILSGQTHLFAQQQNSDEVPRVGADRSADFGNDTNYGLNPQASRESFDKRTNPVNYPNPEDANRNTISTSLIGISQGFLYMEWEHLASRMFGFVFGATFYASEIGQTRRLFQAANSDNSSFMTLGGMIGFTFYIRQQYTQGLAVQIKFGGGLLTGSYLESGQTTPTAMFDIYGSLLATMAYRLNVTPNVAISPVLMINPNIIIVSSSYQNALSVPSFFRINGHSDLLGLSAPADLSSGGGTLLLFMHIGIGVDLTFTF
ncbi:hypothetical protein P0082_04745 [Candidatus Haliotispira prima]|uniref:Outer membrane protein beta-barrel domain-containing protein n=1 Tax=Candidatus Haliotispira prima TaxID=3034016 RepID=A0ABY8MJH8_9SPIO|nr:hypothetical protein P0082_04745 [Candidatus Haliotispira prima]